MKCPVCRNDNSKFKFTVNGYKIVECKTCSHVFAEVSAKDYPVYQIYSDEYFFGGEDGYPDYIQDRDMLIARGEQYADIVGKYIKPGSLFDIGTAAGFIM